MTYFPINIPANCVLLTAKVVNKDDYSELVERVYLNNKTKSKTTISGWEPIGEVGTELYEENKKKLEDEIARKKWRNLLFSRTQ